MACLAERGRGLLALHAVRQATDPRQAQQIIAAALPPLVASILQPAELEAIRQRLKELPAPPDRVRLCPEDWRGARGVFLLVFLSTFPVVIPFFFLPSVRPALRVSNAIAIGLLFLTGYAFGRITGAARGGRGGDGDPGIYPCGHHHGAGRVKRMRCPALLPVVLVCASKPTIVLALGVSF